VFDVKRSIFGVLMYALCAIVVVLIIFHASWYTLSLGWASFYSAVPVDISTWLIFGLLLLAIAFTFIDLAKTQKKAEEQLRQGINKPKKSHSLHALRIKRNSSSESLSPSMEEAKTSFASKGSPLITRHETVSPTSIFQSKPQPGPRSSEITC
jgi:hypothetical protein